MRQIPEDVVDLDAIATLEARLARLDAKIDMHNGVMLGEIKMLSDLVATFVAEIRRTTTLMRNEHSADREVIKQAIRNQGRRS